jgi:kumamolisin
MNRFLVTCVAAAGVFAGSAGAASALTGDGIAANVPGFVSVASLVGPAPPSQQIHLVMHLAYPRPAAVAAFARAVNSPESPSYGAFLTPDQFAARFGPSGHSYSTVEYVATNAGIGVVQTYPNRKLVDLVATVAQADALFNTVINQYNYNNVMYYANGSPAHIPAALNGIVMAVSGFDNFAHKVAQPPPGPSRLGFGPRDIQRAYNEPIRGNPAMNGAGATIAIETAYDYLDSDLQAFWSAYGVSRTGAVTRTIVDDPVNQGLPPPGPSDETTLDVEQTTSNAPGASVEVYEAADTLNSTFDDLYERTVIDPHADVVTTSFGSCEAGSDPNEVAADNDLFEQGAAEGQTRFAASGDSGSHDCALNSPPFGLPGYPNPDTVDFPASSPYVAAAGGTTLALNRNHTIASETAWAGTGGGVSMFFARPFYQAPVTTLAKPHMRNVPDVALDADPNAPYAMAYLGSFAMPVGGTSAVAPNLAALYAQIDGHYAHRLGLAQTGLYNGFRRGTYPGAAWHDIVTGNNGDFGAHAGYDNVTGVGSLDGMRYMLQIPPTKVSTPL